MVEPKVKKPLPYNPPLDKLILAIRDIKGWKLASMKTYANQENRVVTELWFAHRGGFLFPKRKLRRVDGVFRVYEWVDKGKAHVWVHWEAAMASAASD